MNFALAFVVKAVFLILLFGAARIIAWCIVKVLPDGKLKKFLMYDDGKFP